MLVISKHYDIKGASGNPKAVVKELICTALVEEEILPERKVDEMGPTGDRVHPVVVQNICFKGKVGVTKIGD